MEKEFYVYILAGKRNGTLYTGVTSNLIKRIWQHKNELIEGFSKKYNIIGRIFMRISVNVVVWIPAFAGMTLKY
jgi:putative endonuclease